MTNDTENINIVSNYLISKKELAVQRIVIKARGELPDYRLRDIEELTAAVNTTYINWLETIATNEFSHSRINSQNVITKGIESGRQPDQIARTPWIMYEVAIDLLNEVINPEVQNALKNCDYVARAFRLTNQITTIGHLTIASTILSQQMGNTLNKKPS